MADLALSFPTLLFALAVPRRGLDAACAIASAIDGSPLAEVALAAGVPLWLRKCPPEVLTGPLPVLPDNAFFRRRIANHLPRGKAWPIWLGAVSSAAEHGDDGFAVWVAKEIVRDRQAVKIERLRRVAVWAWYSRVPDTFAHGLIEKPWSPEMQFHSALAAAEEWHTDVELHANLGCDALSDMWLSPALVRGCYFRPLATASEIADEAHAMNNCLRTYGDSVARNYNRLWSVRKDGQRIATLCLGFRHRDPLPHVVQLKGPGNSEPSFDMWLTVRHWLIGNDLARLEALNRVTSSVPLDRATWITLWRPFWLAKRRIPDWLPLAPSRKALAEL